MARRFVAHVLAVRGAHGSVWTRQRFGRDARIGCARAKPFMVHSVIWLNYRNGHLQPKSKRHGTKSHATKNGRIQLKVMQLKVGMQKNIGKEDQQGAIYVFTLFSRGSTL